VGREVARAADALVNLAGAPLARLPWTPARRAAILGSRARTTALLGSRARTTALLADGFVHAHRDVASAVAAALDAG